MEAKRAERQESKRTEQQETKRTENKRLRERSNEKLKEWSNERTKNGATREQESGAGWVGCPGRRLPAWHGVQVEFERMISLATHPIIFTSRVESLAFETHDDDNLQNKIEKYITPCRLANAIDPAKRDAKRVRNE